LFARNGSADRIYAVDDAFARPFNRDVRQKGAAQYFRFVTILFYLTFVQNLVKLFQTLSQ